MRRCHFCRSEHEQAEHDPRTASAAETRYFSTAESAVGQERRQSRDPLDNRRPWTSGGPTPFWRVSRAFGVIQKRPSRGRHAVRVGRRCW
jgi:hypothetical protein